MVRCTEDLLAHGAAILPGRLCHPRKVDGCCPGSFGEHTLGRQACDPTKRPIPFDKYLEQVNREERELARCLAFCPAPAAHEWRRTAEPRNQDFQPFELRAGERLHQDCHRPQAARIGDVPPPARPLPATAKLRQTYQILPAVQPGGVLNVVI